MSGRNLGSFSRSSTGFAWGWGGAGVNPEAEANVESSVSGWSLQKATPGAAQEEGAIWQIR